ncbi:unnamed protein product [Caenorhabditis bovis]|uniref:Uncharacterized protein n=1 Tax=Caenorhabditis bovis TaxID=2654633 RepID=A0A8S1EYU6_9PELO|nr:unnamed protein product [Caenorhabditis bovis]
MRLPTWLQIALKNAILILPAIFVFVIYPRKFVREESNLEYDEFIKKMDVERGHYEKIPNLAEKILSSLSANATENDEAIRDAIYEYFTTSYPSYYELLTSKDYAVKWEYKNCVWHAFQTVFNLGYWTPLVTRSSYGDTLTAYYSVLGVVLAVFLISSMVAVYKFFIDILGQLCFSKDTRRFHKGKDVRINFNRREFLKAAFKFGLTILIVAINCLLVMNMARRHDDWDWETAAKYVISVLLANYKHLELTPRRIRHLDFKTFGILQYTSSHTLLFASMGLFVVYFILFMRALKKVILDIIDSTTRTKEKVE